MRRGDIYFANLNPTVGSEIRKKRPVLIVSNNANNKYAFTLTIVPIKSNINKVYPFEVFLDAQDSHLSKRSKCHQVSTISKIRIEGDKAGFINKEVMLKINAALKLHLDL
jgi:mRNA interferase MazF